jgi:hypothetical protein
MRIKAGNQYLPIFAGELGTYAVNKETKKNWSLVTQLIHKVADQDPNIYVIETNDLTPKNDKIHFDTESQRKLGQRYAEAFLNTINK